MYICTHTTHKYTFVCTYRNTQMHTLIDSTHYSHSCMYMHSNYSPILLHVFIMLMNSDVPPVTQQHALVHMNFLTYIHVYAHTQCTCQNRVTMLKPCFVNFLEQNPMKTRPQDPSVVPCTCHHKQSSSCRSHFSKGDKKANQLFQGFEGVANSSNNSLSHHSPSIAHSSFLASPASLLPSHPYPLHPSPNLFLSYSLLILCLNSIPSLWLLTSHSLHLPKLIKANKECI